MLGINRGEEKAKLRRSVKNNDCRIIPKNRQNDIAYYDLPEEYISKMLIDRAKLISKSEDSHLSDAKLKETLSEIHKYLIIVKLENTKYKLKCDQADKLIRSYKYRLASLNRLVESKDNSIAFQANEIETLMMKVTSDKRDLEEKTALNELHTQYIKKLEKNALYYKLKYAQSQKSFMKKFILRLRKALAGRQNA